ncbi:MAG: LuxR family transcriptional regulator [Pseudomonadota bacterium]
MLQHIETIEEFAKVVEDVSAPGELWQALLDFFHCHNFPMVSYHHLPGLARDQDEARIIADGFPEDWVCHYIEQKLYLVDPIPKFAEQTSRPFLWSEIPQMKKLLTEETAYLEELKSSHIGEGVAIQVFGPAMRNGYVGVGFGGRNRALEPAQLLELQCVCQMAHLRYCEQISGTAERDELLSRREREILNWMARGKSNAVIADILDISAHTVDTHVRRIFSKLDVQDRTTAAIRGIGSGLIRGVA